MKKAGIIFLFPFFIAQWVCAQPVTIQLPATGQTISYHPGDDGDLRNGAPLPANRFIDHGNGSATDLFTGLMWATDANLLASRNPSFDKDRTQGDGDINWKTALDYIELLNTENYLGYHDWRLPNFPELRSLIDLSKINSALPDNQPFINLRGGYWSSTTSDYYRWAAVCVFLSTYTAHSNLVHPSGETATFAKNLDFYSINYYRLYLLPVRSVNIFPVAGSPVSGQKISYYPGDDGQTVSGIPWPSPRLVDHKNGSVTDRLTGLMWTRDANLMLSRDPGFSKEFGRVTWTVAFDYVDKLNNENYLGYNDWRLPNRHELQSLISFGRHSPGLPVNHPFRHADIYQDSSITSCWSSTTLARNADQAWFVHFRDGMMADGSRYDKSAERYVWPVRTGNNALPEGSVEGHIRGDGINPKGIEISLQGPINVKTLADASGHYEFNSLPAGIYQIIPFHDYYSFTPTTKTAAIAGSSLTCDFDAGFNRAYGWKDISSGLFPLKDATGTTLHGMYFINDLEGWITSVQNIYHTTDGGKTFEIQETMDFCSAIFMFNENEGYAGGNDGWIYHTIDGGEKWTLVNTIGANVHDISFAPGSTTGFCCGANGQLWKITPTGLEKINTGLVSDITSISGLSASTAVFTAGIRIVYYDGSTLTQMLHPTGFQTALHLSGDHLGWMVGESGVISGLVDLQTQWVKLKTMNENDHLYSVHSPNGKDVWAVGVNGLILHSPNGNDFFFNNIYDFGNHTIWNIQAAGLTNSFLEDVFFTSPVNGYAVGDNGTLLKYSLLEGAPSGAEILGISIPGQTGPARIDSAGKNATVEVFSSVDQTKIVPEIFLSAGATIHPPSGVVQDFTSPVQYIVTASDTRAKTWTVSVTKASGMAAEPMADVKIFPNPASGKFRIQCDGQRSGILKVELIDLNGSVVSVLFEGRPGAEVMEFDVSNLPVGVYFCRIGKGKSMIARKIVIIR